MLAAQQPVVLFVDTFNGGFETENTLAALKVLRAGGYTVHVARKGEGRAGGERRPGKRKPQDRGRGQDCAL